MTMFLRGPQGPKEGFNMVVDTESTRSYLSAKSAQILNLAVKTMKIRQYEVRTFLGCGVKQLKEVTLEVYLPTGRYAQMPMLIDDDFKLEMNVRGLNVAVNNLKKLNYQLAAKFDESSNHIPLEGLIGNDILQHFDFKTVKSMASCAIEIPSGLIPFGNSEHFFVSRTSGKTFIMLLIM